MALTRATSQSWRSQLGSAQRGPDHHGLIRDVAAVSSLQHGADLRGAQLGRSRRIRGPGQQLQHIGGLKAQAAIGVQGGGKEVPQLVAQPGGLPVPLPDQRLMRAGHHLDRLRLVSVIRDRPQLVRVGPDHVRQDVPVAGIALGPGTACRSRYRAARSGFTANTTYPDATSAVTHTP